MTINSSANGTFDSIPASASHAPNRSAAANAGARPSEPIAIVGVSGKFAGSASTPENLWKMLAAGEGAWSRIPEDRFDVNSFYHPDKDRAGRNHAIGGHFMDEDVALFDAGFFNLPADVASAMDPQLRLLLESVYEAMEDAGIPMEKIAGTDTSMYTGCYGKDYHDLHSRDPEAMPAPFLTGNGTAMLSNRVSHFYDLQGPSMSIDTGCSAGLVALHQGCRSIQSGESELSIVGASTTILNPDLYIAMSMLSMVGEEGKCYAWDARAQGYGRGEGVATLVLKSLDAAIRDGDRVHAVIRETGLNQDGKTQTITSPSIDSQVKLIQQCYRKAGLDIADTGYVEAHMTGTPTGDLAEATALAQTFGKSRQPNDPVYIGSVKTNIGHTEPVSGLAAVIKTIWAMKHKQIPRNINYETPNPKIRQQEWNLTVPTSLTPWPQNKALRASINNFGYGGTNAHVILDGAPEQFLDVSGRQIEETPRARVHIVSAKDKVALKAMLANLAEWAPEHLDDSALGDLAYTLAERRSRLPWMSAVSASSVTELAERLKEPTIKMSHATKKPRLGFVFNGQGAQWHAMGRELIGAYPVFAESVHKADKILKGHGATWSLYEELLRDAKTTRVSEVNLSQPITVGLQLCLIDLLRSWGVEPSAITSHSSGEIAGAYAVGALTFSEALAAAFYRGELALRNEALKSLSGGMMAAGLGQEEAAKYIADTDNGRVVVACVNSPGSVTLSGDLPALEQVEARLQADGIFARRLKVPLAYHSHHMLCFAQDYTDSLTKLLAAQPKDGDWVNKVRFASPVTGKVVTSAETLGPKHWADNLTNAVLFSQSFDAMCFNEDGKRQVDMIVELGAHGTLAGPIRQILKPREEIPYVSCLQRGINAVETMQNVACELLSKGYPIDIEAVNSPLGEKHHFVYDLPTYAWNHSTRYWTEPRVNKEIRHKRFAPHELLGSLLPGDNGLTPTWRNFLRLSDVSWLIDHQIDGSVVLPGAGYIAMAIEATRLLDGPADTITAFQLRDIEITNALAISDSSAGVETQLQLRPSDKEAGWYEFLLSSLTAAGTWIVNCKGSVKAEKDESAKEASQEAALHSQSFFHPGVKPTQVSEDALFASLRQSGIYHGSSFRNLGDIQTVRKKAITDLTIPTVVSEAHDYVIHPTTLDAIVVAAYTNLPKKLLQSSMVVPRSMRKLTIRSGLNRHSGEKLQAFTENLSADSRGFSSNIAVINQDDERSLPVFELDEFFAQAVPRGAENPDANLPMTSKLQWELDIFTSKPAAAFADSLRITPTDQQAEFENKLLRATYLHIADAVREIEKTGYNKTSEKWEAHIQRLYEWLKEVVKLGETGKLAPRSKTWARTSKGMKQMLVDELIASKNASASLTVRIGQQLASIIRGEVAPQSLAKEGDLVQEYLADYPKLKERTGAQLAQIIELFAVKRPGAKVLGLGAGLGAAATETVLQAFAARASDGTRSLLGHYTFTAASSDSLQAASQKLASWSDLIDFKALDIEKNPLEQSFERGYDLIIASQAFQGTESVQTALSNVQKLLAPGGKLILIETTKDRADSQLVFATLPSFKESKSVESWDATLRDAGFSGVDLEVADSEEPNLQTLSLILTTAKSTKSSYPATISIVHPATVTPPAEWVEELSTAIQDRTGVTPITENLDELEAFEDKAIIFTAELEKPFVHHIGEADFGKLQRLLVNSQNLLWLSAGGAIDSEIPVYGQTQGLLRTVRQEDAGKRLIQLDFTAATDLIPWTNDKIGHIVDVFEQSFDSSLTAADRECEYSVKDSTLHISRAYPDLDVQEASDVTPVSLDKSDSTYLIVGGMGGIGRSIVSWLMENGAKNLLVVSRKAEASSEVPDMQAAAKADGCNLQIRSCDVSDEQALVKLLKDTADVLPPVRGVINAAMALEDTVLERMTYDQWQKGIRAKVDSSINLNTHLPNLDFFIFLSSVTGVAGHTSQSNYTAGNTFQDALARHRTLQGESAIALNLSAIKGAGWVASQGAEGEQEVLKRVEHLGAVSADVDFVLELLEKSIREPRPTSPADSQVVVGLARDDAIPEDSVTRLDRRFGTLRLSTPRGASSDAAEGSDSADSLSVLNRALAAGPVSKADAVKLIVDVVAGKTASIFNIEQEVIDPSLSLSKYGVDSLVAVDLRNYLATSLRARVSIFDILQTPSLAEFGALLAEKSELIAK
ncbi:polyketide synthase [Aspergillus uvarum CBS 121591]|uniref:Polyketide synthase n=1 Tax=Aspergillus uvarum CBS 121591 TaxID=1448315 RepID=A0A319CNC7_9EURO|nr:polyketide synthase [Aspergillus uvarum CBS 121591]PYH87006.1 polyketide synthase [Aspergillus uvarum CBS 121591]